MELLDSSKLKHEHLLLGIHKTMQSGALQSAAKPSYIAAHTRKNIKPYCYIFQKLSYKFKYKSFSSNFGAF